VAVVPDLSGCALDGRYELHSLIGEGAFGRVYRGHDRRLSRPVAVKVIKPWWSEDPRWARRFEREAQLLARLADRAYPMHLVTECLQGRERVADQPESRGVGASEVARSR